MRAARAGAGAARRAFALAGARTGPSGARVRHVGRVRRKRRPRTAGPRPPPDRATTRWVCPARGSNSSNFPWTRSRRAREARTPCWSARTAPCTRAALTISASSGTPPAPRTRRFPKRWRASRARPGGRRRRGALPYAVPHARRRGLGVRAERPRAVRPRPGARGYAASAAPTPRWLASLSPEAPGGDDRGPVTNIAARGTASRSRRTALFSRGARTSRGASGTEAKRALVSTLRNRPSCERPLRLVGALRRKRSPKRSSSLARLVRTLADAGVRERWRRRAATRTPWCWTPLEPCTRSARGDSTSSGWAPRATSPGWRPRRLWKFRRSSPAAASRASRRAAASTSR